MRSGSLRLRIEPYIRKYYRHYIRPRLSREMHRQRIKLIWGVWGYWPLLFVRSLPLLRRLELVVRFLRVDWHVPHAHGTAEIAAVCQALGERRAAPDEVLLEAGCWVGGSSAKFSILCRMLGYRLCLYDSFQGVEQMAPEELAGNYDFSGAYAASEEVLRENLRRYGEVEVCSVHKGWFRDTLKTVPYRVRVAYIDCDLATGTREALAGIVPALVEDGWIFSQDYHIRPVRELLSDPETWTEFGKGKPILTHVVRNLASIRFPRRPDTER